jgi:orotate phosphoribosyltransferase
MDLLRETGVLHQGHFRLTSGKHSDTYLQCALVLQYPDKAGLLCSQLATIFKDQAIDLVIGPAIGAVVMAQETARALGVRAIFTERENGRMALRRGFSIRPGERVLAVEDVVTTGGSVQEVLEVVQELGGVPVGVGAIVDRSSGQALFPVPLHALIKVEAKTYEPNDCPLCRQGLPLTKPGSRQV